MTGTRTGKGRGGGGGEGCGNVCGDETFWDPSVMIKRGRRKKRETDILAHTKRIEGDLHRVFYRGGGA